MNLRQKMCDKTRDANNSDHDCMYHTLYCFTLLFIKLLSHLPGIIEGYLLWINSYTKNYGICMECYIAMARSKEGCSDVKGIFREFFNATRVFILRLWHLTKIIKRYIYSRMIIFLTLCKIYRMRGYGL